MTNCRKTFLKSKLVSSVCFSVATLGIMLMFSPVQAEDAKPAANIFPEGNFETPDGTGWVMGWPDVPNPNDTPWKSGARMSVGEESVDEKKNHFAHIKTTPEFPGFYAVGASVALPPGTKQVTLSIRSRGKVEDKPKSDWHGARLTIQLNDAEGKPINGANGGFIGDLQATREEWKRDQTTLDLPEGTQSLYVMLIVGGLVGQFDFDDVEVTATKGPTGDVQRN